MRRALPWLPGLVLLGAGTLVYLRSGSLPRRFTVHGGSYDPLSGRSWWRVGWTAGQLAGAGVAVVGLVLLTALAGRALAGRTGARALPWTAGGLGAVAVVGGAVLFARAGEAGPTGWFASAPLSTARSPAYTSTLELSFDAGPQVVLWSGQQTLGAGLVVLGLLVLAALGGWLPGRRRRPVGPGTPR